MTSAFREKMLSIGVMSRSPRVIEGRDAEGCRTKTVIDDAGNHVTEHNNSKDQVDVAIKAPSVQLISREIPHG